tara:strand:+ start:150 stop:266 length:117 start_codon:yes stop_codon:yes gene_type:complete
MQVDLKKDQRQQRIKEALRKNLKKRKAFQEQNQKKNKK